MKLQRRCPGCGYDITGIPSHGEPGARRCPECGRVQADAEWVAETAARIRIAAKRERGPVAMAALLFACALLAAVLGLLWLVAWLVSI